MNAVTESSDRPKEAPNLSTESFLICRAASLLFALPVKAVLETMRALPLSPLASAPSFVLGVSVIRGGPVPVLDTASLLRVPGGDPKRYVLIETSRSNVVLTADEVVEIRPIPPDTLKALPPILSKADPDAIESIGTADARLLVVLRGAILLPDSVWTAITEKENA